jgi:ferredoxin
MRFNWFVSLPRTGDGQNGKKSVGRVRRLLRTIAPSWVSSPFRRLAQCLCLAAFLWLFLYVCWPYTARPARSWHGWIPVEVDVESGNVTVEVDQAPDHHFVPGMGLHVSDASSEENLYLGSFAVTSVGDQQLRLEPVEPLAQEQLDVLATTLGPWSLSEGKPGSWPSHYADDFLGKESVAAELFLILDPLVSISAAIAARCWVWSLVAAGVILLVCVFVPRGFCGYVCPLGTLIDLFDWTIGKRVPFLRLTGRGWWVHIKYCVLVGVLTGAVFGVLLSGFVAAIPVVTRAAAFLLTPFQTGISRDWHQIPSIGTGQFVSLALFCLVLGLGFLRPRFWCRYVCPTGALFSIGSLLRLTERKVEVTCIHCKKCADICPFDAIEPAFTTRAVDCTFCQTCGGVCPTRSVKFVPRWEKANLKQLVQLAPKETSVGRRRFLNTAAGVAASVVGGGGLAAASRLSGPDPDDSDNRAVVRPPGSVPEDVFLELCIRCGECYQACPNDVLQPLGFQRGLDGLWTPQVVADWSGCEPSCSNCGQVCPTGAIRALPLDEKRVVRMGLAVVNEQTCLPYAGREECDLCVQECRTAGYGAIEFIRRGTELDPFGEAVEGSGFLAPVVLPDKCVGCGLCQTRCYKINVKTKGLLAESAIQVEAGEGKEDRLMRGSYIALREEEKRKQEEEQRTLQEQSGSEDGYLPDFLK